MTGARLARLSHLLASADQQSNSESSRVSSTVHHEVAVLLRDGRQEAVSRRDKSHTKSKRQIHRDIIINPLNALRYAIYQNPPV